MITHHCNECGEEIEEMCYEHPNAHIDSIVHCACGEITGETITDEQIRELQQSIAGHVFPAAGMAHTELSEVYETCTLALYGGTWSPPSPRSDARARCAEILNARNRAS